MKAAIVYPLPFDAWPVFEQEIYRFAYTFKQYPPGDDYWLALVCNWGEPTDEIRKLFQGTKSTFVDYPEDGCDIGSAQHVARMCDSPRLVLAMTTRCYFHREGWLKRYVEARAKYGPGLYGASGSWQEGTPHICTRGYAMDAGLWQRYPHIIDTRDKGPRFEAGDWCVSRWVQEDGMPLVQVTWDGERLFPHWRHPDEKEIFRRGGQAAMLVWDRHTKMYEEADDAEKQRLAALSDPPCQTNPAGA